MNFIDFALDLWENYGSNAGIGDRFFNDPDDFLVDNPNDPDLFVICPECGDPIICADCDNLEGEIRCPACEFSPVDEY